jgi:hypothetical protein
MVSILDDAADVLRACEHIRNTTDHDLPEMAAERLARWVLGQADSIRLAEGMRSLRIADAVLPEVVGG